jgi:DNA-binding LacI/PurR family transcriptional regulator
MKVMILLYEGSDRQTSYLVEMLHRLQDAGHQTGFATKTMKDLGMSADRISRFVQRTEADAWIVVAGPLQVLAWFAQQPKPAFALFGRSNRTPMASASIRKGSSLAALVRRLVALGHQRVVMLSREDRRKPILGQFEQMFLSQLQEHGILTGNFNLPDWGDSPQELQRVLTSLFLHTPPTALIIDDTRLFLPAMQHLARLGFVAPEQVSLACTDHNPNFEWCLPAITHITWDAGPIVQRVLKWADNVSRGKEDLRRTTKNARLVIGGTIGPVPR